MQQASTEQSRTEEKRRNVEKNKETTGKTPWHSHENSNSCHREEAAQEQSETIYIERVYRVIVTVSATLEYIFFKRTSSSVFAKCGNDKNLC